MVCGRALHVSVDLCKALGISITEHKLEGPAPIRSFQGIQIDMIHARKRAPHGSCGPGDAEDRLDVGKVESYASFFFFQGLASSYQKTYKSGENRYLRFCQSLSAVPLLISESRLCNFVSFLADQKLKRRTINTYLFGVRYFQIKLAGAIRFTMLTCLTWST